VQKNAHDKPFSFETFKVADSYNEMGKICYHLFICLPVGCTGMVSAQTILPAASELKKLSFEELMSIEVTSVSKVPERLTEVASAIQVITNDDIKRSASNTLARRIKTCIQPAGGKNKFA
jgi:outer membrane receptor for ferrienterochelin and colicin